MAINKQTHGVSLALEHSALLERYAQERNISKSEIIRQALDALFAKWERDEAQRQRKCQAIMKGK